MHGHAWLCCAITIAGCSSSTVVPDSQQKDVGMEAGFTCVATGGSCIAIGQCSKGLGHLGVQSCPGSASICCIPWGWCGDESFSCCSGTVTFRPICAMGQLICAQGQSRCNASDARVERGARDVSPDVTSCAAVGGACKGVGQCSKGQGHIGAVSCGGASVVCCIPWGQCGGPEDFSCCTGSAAFRPVCTSGKLECSAGQSKCPLTDGG